MRDWGFAPAPEELDAVSAAFGLYRDHCASLHRPIDAAFDGSADDVHTLDYLAYEGIEPRGAGIESAALVCGEVLRRAAGMEWVINYRGDWFVASGEEAAHSLAVCPLARLHELECRGRRGGGMHLWFVQSVAFDWLPFVQDEAFRGLRALLGGGSYLEHVGRSLGCLDSPSVSGRPKKRRR